MMMYAQQATRTPVMKLWVCDAFVALPIRVTPVGECQRTTSRVCGPVGESDCEVTMVVVTVEGKSGKQWENCVVTRS